MSRAEFIEWIAAYRVEPWGDEVISFAVWRLAQCLPFVKGGSIPLDAFLMGSTEDTEAVEKQQQDAAIKAMKALAKG